jgi:hypothetical protein
VPSEQPKGQLQTQHSLDTGNYIIYQNYRQALVEEIIIIIITAVIAYYYK